jgi:hypothetical protein
VTPEYFDAAAAMRAARGYDDGVRNEPPLWESADTGDSADTADTGATSGNTPLFRTKTAAEFTTRSIRWLVPDLIPEEMLTVLVAEEGTGKGLYWCYLAAQLTHGGQPVTVVATEDAWEHIIRPRLEAAGADLGMVHTIVANEEGSGARLTLPTHGPELVGLLAQTRTRALFLDPWVSLVSPALKVKDPQDARKAIDPLIHLAEKAGVAVVAVVHPNRGEGSLRNRVGLTGVLRQAARSVCWMLAEPDTNVRWLGQEKTNLNRGGLPSHRFTIETTSVLLDDGQRSETPYLVPATMPPETRSITQVDDDLTGQRDPRNHTDQWLRLRLADGAVQGKQIEAEAQSLNISSYALANACRLVGVVKRPRAFGEPWEWALPNNTQTPRSHQYRQSAQSEQSAETPRVGVDGDSVADTGTTDTGCEVVGCDSEATEARRIDGKLWRVCHPHRDPARLSPDGEGQLRHTPTADPRDGSDSHGGPLL